MTTQTLTSDQLCAAYYELVVDAIKHKKFAGSHNIFTKRDIVDQILTTFPTLTGSWLVLYNLEFAISLIYTYNVNPKDITFYSDHTNKSLVARKKLNINVIDKIDAGYETDLKRLVKMKIKFHNSVSNVPYNTREESYTGDVEVAGGKMGTVGDKTLGKKLNKLQRQLTEDGGNIAQMGLKKSMLDDCLSDNHWNLKTLSLMVDRAWWDYNTFWAVGKKEHNTHNYTVFGDDIDSKICAKIFARKHFKHHTQSDSLKQLYSKGFITDTPNNNPLCIVRNQKKNDMQILRAYPTDKGLSKVIYGPKFTHYMAESAITWLATDEPMLCDCAVIWPHDSIDLARKQKLFTEKNPLLKYLHKKLKFKGQDQFWFYTKLFDLTQIQTGLEFPVEYGLTPDEQNYINENFARN
jgi:hypothetical protein